MLFEKAPLYCRNRKSANSPASRARCLKPALPDPRWTYRFRQPHLRGAAYPPLRGQAGASRYDRANIGRHWSPVARGQRAGTEQLRLPRGVVRLVTLIAATAAGPSLVTFARLPLAGPGKGVFRAAGLKSIDRINKIIIGCDDTEIVRSHDKESQGSSRTRRDLA